MGETYNRNHNYEIILRWLNSIKNANYWKTFILEVSVQLSVKKHGK